MEELSKKTAIIFKSLFFATSIGLLMFYNILIAEASTITISGVGVVASPSQTRTTISWSTDIASDSQVEFGTTSSYGNTTTLDSTATTSHSVVVTGLTPNTSYHYRIRSSDGGPVASSSDNYFYTNFLTQWGTSGSGVGQFSSLGAIAVDSSGNLYVAAGSNRIQKFDSNGNYLLTWGSSGSSNGQFSTIEGITVSAGGYVYVTDYNNNRVQKFDTSGSFIATWGSSGTTTGKFAHPEGISTDTSENVYVVDRDNQRVQKFDSDGNFISTWGTEGTGDGQLFYPNGIKVTSDGFVYVADTFHPRIEKFNTSGTYISSFGNSGTGFQPLQYPRAVGVDSSGNIYTANTGFLSASLKKYDSSGVISSKWGTYGTEDGRFRDIQGIAIDSSDNIYITDGTNLKVSKFGAISDVTAPTLSSASISGATLTLNYNELLDTYYTPSTGDFVFKVNGTATSTSAVSISSSTASISLPDAVPAGATITVSYTSGASPIADVYGNLAGNLTNQSVTNLTPVSISGIATSTATSSVTITWNTDSAATSTIVYGTSTAYTATSSSSIATTSHSYNLTGLSEGTTYHFMVYVFDSLGNTATSSDCIFTTGTTPSIAGTRTGGGSVSSFSTNSTNLNTKLPATNSLISAGLPTNLQFKVNRSYGIVNNDVQYLQIFLNRMGYPVAQKGYGSLGFENKRFGPGTTAALAKFQKDNGIKPAVGYLGPITRNFINAMLKKLGL